MVWYSLDMVQLYSTVPCRTVQRVQCKGRKQCKTTDEARGGEEERHVNAPRDDNAPTDEGGMSRILRRKERYTYSRTEHPSTWIVSEASPRVEQEHVSYYATRVLSGH